MLIKKAQDLRESDVTPKELYLRRREFIAAAGVTAAAVATNGLNLFDQAEVSAQNPNAQKLANLKKSPFSTDEKLNSYKDITTYNNFYEFGLDKADPSKYASTLRPRPWSVVVDGQCGKPGRQSRFEPLQIFLRTGRQVEVASEPPLVALPQLQRDQLVLGCSVRQAVIDRNRAISQRPLQGHQGRPAKAAEGCRAVRLIDQPFP